MPAKHSQVVNMIRFHAANVNRIQINVRHMFSVPPGCVLVSTGSITLVT